MNSNDRNGHLLSDECMQEFIRNGYVTVRTALPEEFHASICRQADALFGAEPNPGNNLLPRLPDLARMLADPPVHGALTSILGPGYLLDDHRYCHDNQPGSEAQRLHQDGGSQGDHRTRKVLLLYYPQDTPEHLGPTGVLPGSQYYRQRPQGTAMQSVTGGAGTVAITHYELWHGATANRAQRPRYMMKFLLHPHAGAGGAELERPALPIGIPRVHCGAPSGAGTAAQRPAPPRTRSPLPEPAAVISTGWPTRTSSAAWRRRTPWQPPPTAPAPPSPAGCAAPWRATAPPARRAPCTRWPRWDPPRCRR